MRFLSIYGSTLLACGISLCALPAMAYQTGDTVLRFGASLMAPNDKSSAFTINSSGVAAVSQGSGAKVGSSAAAELGLMYMFAPQFAAEFKVGTPYQQRIKTKAFSDAGVNHAAENFGRARLWSPEVNLQWYPMAAQSEWQPYLGAGLHYAMFKSEKVAQETINGLQAPATLSLKNKLGWNAQAGLDWVLSDHWAVNASARYVAIKTTARASAQNQRVMSTDLKINPIVYTLGVSYNF